MMEGTSQGPEQVARERDDLVEALTAWTKACFAAEERARAAEARVARLEAALTQFIEAIDWVGADSFDMCPECMAKLAHAQSNGRLVLSEVAVSSSDTPTPIPNVAD